MQDKRINAFRARMLRDGYENVRIFFDGVSHVTVYASYRGKSYRQVFSVSCLVNYPLKVYFDEEF